MHSDFNSHRLRDSTMAGGGVLMMGSPHNARLWLGVHTVPVSKYRGTEQGAVRHHQLTGSSLGTNKGPGTGLEIRL